MKKALKILGIAIVAAAVFAGCEQGPQDVNSEVTYKQVGEQNYKFNDKTFTQVNTSNIFKVVLVDSSDAHIPTTSTVTAIPYYTDTTTVVFADDGTFTVTNTGAYLAGADGDYRTYTATAGTLTTTTLYTFNPNVAVPVEIDQIYAGRAGIVAGTETYAGNWDSFKEADSAFDGKTLNYVMTFTSQSTTTPNYDNDYTPLTSAGTGYTSTAKTVYKVVNNDTINVTFEDIEDLTYSFKGTAVVGEDEVDQVNMSTSYFAGAFYEVEE